VKRGLGQWGCRQSRLVESQAHRSTQSAPLHRSLIFKSTSTSPCPRTDSTNGSVLTGVGVASLQNWWSSTAALHVLKRKRYERPTQLRIYEADVYPATLDFYGWRLHRSSKRYMEHILTIFRSHMLKVLIGPILATSTFAVIVATYNTAAMSGTALALPFGLAKIFSFVPKTIISAAWEPYSLMSFALSLMLVFRTNSSYARWVEARALWAVLVNSGRNIVRMALASFPSTDPGLKLALGRWAVAFARSSKLHLREEPTWHDGESKQAGTTIRNYTPGSKRDAESNRTTSESGVAKELQDVLQPSEITLVEEAQHRPNLVLQLMSRCVYAAKGLDGSARVAIDTELKQLQDALGGCERILRNPIPLSYTRHTARFLIIWLFLLPLALWEKMHWGVVPATIVVSYLLFGIDEIAIQMEEPFSVLPLEVLCDGLQRDVKEMLDSEDRVQSAVENYLGSWGETGQIPEGWDHPPPLTMSDTDMDSDNEGSAPVPGEGQNVQQGRAGQLASA